MKIVVEYFITNFPKGCQHHSASFLATSHFLYILKIESKHRLPFASKAQKSNIKPSRTHDWDFLLGRKSSPPQMSFISFAGCPKRSIFSINNCQKSYKFYHIIPWNSSIRMYSIIIIKMTCCKTVKYAKISLKVRITSLRDASNWWSWSNSPICPSLRQQEYWALNRPLPSWLSRDTEKRARSMRARLPGRKDWKLWTKEKESILLKKIEA